MLDRFVPNRVSILSRRLSTALARRYGERFQLTIPEWRVMAVLGLGGELSAAELCAGTMMDKVSVSRAVARPAPGPHARARANCANIARFVVFRGAGAMRKDDLSEDAATELSEIFQQLGDPSRVRIVWSCLERPVSAGDVAKRLGLSESLASHHLRLLSAARLLRSEQRGKQMFYAAASERISTMLTDLARHVGESDGGES